MATVETPTEVRATAKYVRTAPRKAQLVTEQIRGRSVLEARSVLAFMTRDAARDVSRVLESAIANAEANHGLNEEELYVSEAYVGAGPTLKRWRARARGRVARIRKRTCHITVLVAPGEVATVGVPPAPAAAPVEAEPEAKPKRATREKAAEPIELEQSEPEAEESKPKRTRARKAAAPADEAKPKRTKRNTKEETEGSEES